MKAQKEQKQDRILIQVDSDLNNYNQKTLKEIFSLVKDMKGKFTDIGITFDRESCLKTFSEGSGWLLDELYKKAVETFKGMSDLVKASMVDRAKLQQHVIPIEPIIVKIKALLASIDLTPDQVPFNEKSEPIINNDLKEFLTEKSKRYATGKDEIELYHVVEEFIAVANKLEACLAKNSYQLLFTKYFDFQSPMRYAETDSPFWPICVVNYENLEADGCAQLQLNPNLFQELESNINAIEDFREHAGLSKQVSGEQSIKIPVAPALRLPRDLGKKIEQGIKPKSK